jgi:hypothetical protein
MALKKQYAEKENNLIHTFILIPQSVLQEKRSTKFART